MFKSLASTFLILASLGHVASAAPSISSISDSKVLVEGSAHSLTVQATGNGTLTYQWQKGGAVIPGATSPVLLFNAITLPEIGRYAVVVSDDDGSTTSDTVLVDVTAADAPYFNNSSDVTTFIVGNSLYLSRSLSGNSPFTYQWFKNGVEISGATNSSIQIAHATADDAGVYTLRATNFKGSATSQPITATVQEIFAPVINSQPSSTIITEGGSSSINFGYYSAINVTVELLRDGEVLQTSSSSISFSSVTNADAGDYRFRVTNSKGSVTSAIFTVYVEPASPAGASINGPSTPVRVGERIRLRNNNYNDSNNTYQWFKNGAPIGGAGSDDLYIYEASLSDAGSYYMEISRGGVTSRSNAVAVSIHGSDELVISQQPASLGYESGQYASLFVSLNSSGNYTYVWTRDSIVIPGQNSNTIELRTFSDAEVFGTYVVTITHGEQTLVSQPAIVSPRSLFAPIITRHPQSRIIRAGNHVYLSVDTYASPSPTFQWFKNNVAIENANSSNLSFSSNDASGAGAYHVQVTNSEGTSTSNPATVVITQTTSSTTPVIIQHPDSYSILAGQTATFQVQVNNSSNNTGYQWFKDDTLIPGANNQYLHVSGEPRNDGQYHAVVTHGEGSITSDKASFSAYLSSDNTPFIFSTGRRAIPSGDSIQLRVNLRNDLPYDQNVRWRKDGILIPHFTHSSIYVRTNSSNIGVYTAEVTIQGVKYVSPPMPLNSIGGTATSSEPYFNTQPSSITVFPGTSGNLGASVSNAVSYQWFKDNQPVPLSNGDSLQFSNASVEISGTYHLVATSSSGTSVTSESALVVMMDGRIPVINRHPFSLSLNSPDNYVSIDVSFTSESSISYQWYRNGTKIPGAISQSFNLRNQPAGDYHVVLTNVSGSVQSLPANITHRSQSTPPTITEHPTSLTRRLGEFASFAVKGMGNGDLSYQWFHNNSPISGANGSQYTIASVEPQHAGIYTLILSSQSGAASSLGVSLTIVADKSPMIMRHPASRTIDAGLSTILSVVATGIPTPTYQWRRNGVDLFGAVSPTLSLINVQRAQAGTYTVLVTNAGGSVLSQPAQLSLTQAGLPIAGRHHAVGNGYTPGETLSVSVRLSYADDIASLGYQVLLPDGWSYVSSSASNTASAPQAGDQSLLEWAWADLPAGPTQFTFTIQAASDLTGPQNFAALIVARRNNQDFEALVNPDPLLVGPATDHHTADLNRDGKLGLSELLRVIELYNTRHLSSRTGRYTPSTDTPDGFTPEATQPASVDLPLTRYHLGDMDRNGRIGLSELLRVIELYNTRAASTRTGTYHRAPTGPDGFAPGTGE